MSSTEMVGALSVGRTLQHYGRLGMRWGVRRSKQQLATDKVGENSLADPDAIKAVTTQAKIKSAGSLNVVSSKDLQDLVKRMELEQKYIKATLEASPKTKKGENFVTKLIKNEADSYFLKGKKGPLTTMVDKLLNPTTDAASGTNKPAKAATNATKNTAKAGANAARVVTRKVKDVKKPPVYNITTLR